MPKTPRQIAALPYRPTEKGGLEFLLVTTRETGRWTIPKGWPMKGLKDHKAAAIEALEEAGVRGKPFKKPVGSFDYVKRLRASSLHCHVDVFALAVRLQMDAWKECDERQRGWFAPEEAAGLVSEPPLKTLLSRAPGILA